MIQSGYTMGVRLLAILWAITAVAGGLWVLVACCAVFLPQLGTLPQGEQLNRIKNSAHYREGQFYNPLPTPKFSGDTRFFLWSGRVFLIKLSG